MSVLQIADLAKLRKVWLEHPEVFMKDVLDITLTQNQFEMLKAIQDNNYISIKSSNSCGKTFLCGGIVLWYFWTRIEDDIRDNTIIVIAAPKFDQVRNGIYADFKTNLSIANDNLTKLFGTPVKLFPKAPSEDQNRAAYYYNEKSFVIGLSTDNQNAIAGKHGENVLVIFDEAQGIKDDVYSGFKGIMQSGKVKEILIGNTTLPNGCAGKFYESFQNDSLYKQLTITAFDTPNFKRTGIVLEDYLREETDPEHWIKKLDRFAKTNYYKAKSEGKLAAWEDYIKGTFKPFQKLQNPISVFKILSEDGFNIESYETKTRILAQFPDGSENITYPSPWIEESMTKWGDPVYHIEGEVAIGVDFGRGVGKDKTAFSVVNGNKHIYLKEEDLDTRGILDRAKELYENYSATVIKIEMNGEGIHLGRMMRELGLNVKEVDVGSSPGFADCKDFFLKEKTKDYKKRYNLKRDEIWWNLREKICPSRSNDEPLFLMIPDLEMKRQMKASTYSKNDKQQIVVAKKKELIKRLKRSPDKLDSLLIALAEVEPDKDNSFELSAFHFKSIKRDW
jgi:hypothetical protein